MLMHFLFIYFRKHKVISEMSYCNKSECGEIFLKEESSNMEDNITNITYSFEEPEHIIATIEEIAVPTICALGLMGNTLSFIVFAQKFLRSKSCSIFLAVRSLSDNGFLIILLIIWSSAVFDLKLNRIIGLCQGTIFLTYVFGCLSVWLVVFVTIENYIRICKPFMVNAWCQTTKAKYVLFILCIIILSCHNFPLWTMTDDCLPDAKYYSFLKIMVYVDSLLTLIIPTCIMSFLLFRIAMSSISSCKRRRRLSTTSTQKMSDLTTKVTTMLLAVSLIFITLNLPLHVVKLRLLIISFVRNEINVSTPLDVTMQSISQLIYYLSLSINFPVYYLFGGTFRKTFKSIFRSKQKSVYAQTDVSTLLFSRARRVEQSSKAVSNDSTSNSNLLKVGKWDDKVYQKYQCTAL